MSVPTVLLGEVAEIERSSVAAHQIADGETYVGLENITTEGSFAEVAAVAAGDLKSNKFRFDEGHVLYGKLRPYLAKIAVPDFRGVCSTDILPIRPGPRVEKRYLLHYLRTPEMVANASKLAVGINLPRLSPKSLTKFPIPLPPIEEQRRISGVLDAADALRAKRRKALARLDSLTQAIFLDRFGDPVVNPRGWPDHSVDGALEFLTYGHRFYDGSYSESGTPVVRITDLNEAGDLDFASMPRMALTAEERAAYRVRAGDLLFARSGATVGKVALMRDGDPECIAGAYFVWMRFVDEINPEYARGVLTSDRVRALIARQSRQAAQQNFSGPAIRRLPMPVPPTSLQAEFAAVVGKVQREKERHQRGTSKLDALFTSLQQRAFRGEL